MPQSGSKVTESLSPGSISFSNEGTEKQIIFQATRLTLQRGQLKKGTRERRSIMKNTLKQIASLALAISSLPALAVYQEGHDRPVMEIRNAEVLSSSYGFAGAEAVNLIMTRRDGSPHKLGFIFEAKALVGGALTPVRYELEVNDIYKEDDGSTVYLASLPQKILEEGAGHRVNLTLIDHSTSNDGNYRDSQWEASIRDGYGWCGTMDSVIEFVGSPTPVYSIEQMFRPEI